MKKICSPRGAVVAAGRNSGGAAERHGVAQHRIAAGDEARRAEEPAVATPQMICALKGATFYVMFLISMS